MSDERTAGQMLRDMGVDAEKWTAELRTVLSSRHLYRPDPGRVAVVVDLEEFDPGGLMHVWLCNAIGAGETAGYAKAKREDHGPDWPLGHRDLGPATQRPEPDTIGRDDYAQLDGRIVHDGDAVTPKDTNIPTEVRVR